MSKRDQPGKPPPVPDPSAASIPVTESQIVQGVPPMPPRKRRSTTHGVGWYGVDQSQEVRKVKRVKVSRILIALGILTGLAAGGAAGYLYYKKPKQHAAVTAPAPVRDAAPAPPDAPPVKTVKLTLKSVPAGAEFTVDGKPLGATPGELQIPENTKVVIDATMAGFQPFHEEVALGAKGKKFVAKLVAIPTDAGPPDAAPPDAAPVKKVTKVQPKKKTKATAKKKKKRPTRTR